MISLFRLVALLVLVTVSSARAEESGVIVGKAIAPIGQSAKGTVASACPFGSTENCVDSRISAEGRVVPFRIPGLDPKIGYSLRLWKDVNGDGKINQGDLVGSYMRYATADRQRSFAPTPRNDPAILPLVYFHQYGNVTDTFKEPFEGKGETITSLSQIVGTWIYEKSGPGEATLRTSTGMVREGGGIKGSSMATWLKPLARYVRNGSLLSVKPDGTFTWVSEDDEFDNNSCSTLESTVQKGSLKPNRNLVKLAYDATTTVIQRQCPSNEPTTKQVEAGETDLAVAFQLGSDKRMRMRLGDGPDAAVFVRQ